MSGRIARDGEGGNRWLLRVVDVATRVQPGKTPLTQPNLRTLASVSTGVDRLGYSKGIGRGEGRGDGFLSGFRRVFTRSEFWSVVFWTSRGLCG